MSDLPRLGIDFGRVIQGSAGEGEDTAFLGASVTDAVKSPPLPGAIDAITRLTRLFARQVWIISKCGAATERKTLAWLEYQRFYERTGMPEGNVRFCRERAEKAIHCAELGITHMIDDRLDVHRAIRDLVPHCYLFGPQDSPAPEWVMPVLTWAEAEAAVTSRF